MIARVTKRIRQFISSRIRRQILLEFDQTARFEAPGIANPTCIVGTCESMIGSNSVDLRFTRSRSSIRCAGGVLNRLNDFNLLNASRSS